MSFDRRDFLKLAGMAGLAVVTPRGAARAQTADDRFWVFVHANGGWDPTSLCDPKGRRDEEEEDPVNHYFTDDIGTAGNIRYAPVAYNAEFFQKHYRRTLVLNGVDSQTNNHDAGTRHTWSGKLSEGYPALAALIAGIQAREAPMAFLSNGGYDDTGGLIAPTRTGNIDALNRIAYPDRVDPNNENGDRYHSPETWDRIQAAIAARQGHLTETLRLPRAQHAINQLFTARVGRNEVRRLSEYLPERFDDDGLKRQAQVAVAAFRAGIGKAANLSIGGFDTHGNHDDSHFRGSPTSCRASTSCGTRPSGTASRTSSSSWWAATSGGRPATTAATARTTGRSRA
ncbi:MAG: twin-arginine translocation signal domain-containing protein [bacterium]